MPFCLFAFVCNQLILIVIYNKAVTFLATYLKVCGRLEESVNHLLANRPVHDVA